MRHAPAAWLAWSLWALCVALEGAALLLLTTTDPAALPSQLLFVPGALAFPTVGAFIAARRPENAIGWLFCAAPLLAIFSLVAEQYFLYSVALRPGALPAGVLVGWLGTWLGTLGWVSLWTFPLLLFPTGRLPSPRWRPVAWAAGAVLAFLTVGQALQPGPLHERVPDVPNPLGIGLEASGQLDLLFVALGLACAASVVVRFRAARDAERQQLKWFAAAATLVLLVLVTSTVLEASGSTVSGAGLPALVGEVLLALALAAVPAAAGVAILRYRLYDIDLIIRRTLVYGALSGLLVVVYLALVVGLQGLFRVLTGQGSNLAIVVATLVSAAFFQPLRGRVQRVIDRRFYRRHYDAARTLAAFTAHLRDEVDLATLTDELVRVVDETMQPSHVSLWLRPGGGRPPGTG